MAHPLLLCIGKIEEDHTNNKIMEDIMKKAAFIISLTLVLALIAGSVFAWGHGRGRHMWGSGYGGQYCQGFNSGNAYSDLSKEQHDQLNTLEQQYTDETYELRAAQIETRQQIRLLMQTSNPDRVKLTRLYDEMDAVEKQLRDKRIDFLLEAKKIAPDFELGYGRGFAKSRGGQRFGKSANGGQGYGPGRCFSTN